MGIELKFIFLSQSVQNLWSVQLSEITVKYAYFAVILRNGNGHRFWTFFFLISLLNFDQTCILIYKNPQKKKRLNYSKITPRIFQLKIDKSTYYFGDLRGWFINFQLKYGRGNFSKIQLFLFFLFLYIKMHVWSKSNNEIQKKFKIYGQFNSLKLRSNMHIWL